MKLIYSCQHHSQRCMCTQRTLAECSVDTTAPNHIGDKQASNSLWTIFMYKFLCRSCISIASSSKQFASVARCTFFHVFIQRLFMLNPPHSPHVFIDLGYTRCHVLGLFIQSIGSIWRCCTKRQRRIRGLCFKHLRQRAAG